MIFTKQQRGPVRICLGFLIGVVSLVFLSLNGLAAEIEKDKKAGQQAGFWELVSVSLSLTQVGES